MIRQWKLRLRDWSFKFKYSDVDSPISNDKMIEGSYHPLITTDTLFNRPTSIIKRQNSSQNLQSRLTSPYIIIY